MIIVEHKKAKGVNETNVPTIHYQCKDVFRKNKCLRYLMNKIQIKDRRIGTDESNKISLLALMIKCIS